MLTGVRTSAAPFDTFWYTFAGDQTSAGGPAAKLEWAGKPFVLKGGAKSMPFWEPAQSDAELRKRYGHEEVMTQEAKKLGWPGPGTWMQLSEWLDVYNTSSYYLIDMVPLSIMRDVLMPSFMSCGGFNRRLAFGSLWGSSGGTRSSVHYDAYESMMCLFSGSKKFILFPPTYSPHPPVHGHRQRSPNEDAGGHARTVAAHGTHVVPGGTGRPQVLPRTNPNRDRRVRVGGGRQHGPTVRTGYRPGARRPGAVSEVGRP